MLKVKSTWTGWTGAPGYTNLYFQTGGETDADALAAGSAVDSFWGDIHFVFPDDVSIAVSDEVEAIDPVTGELTDVLNAGAAWTPWVGTQAGGFSAVSGSCINWRTAGIHQGRRVRGRTFLVPLAGNQYQTDGTLEPAHITLVEGAIETMLDAVGAQLVVWARPEDGAGGQSYLVASGSVRDRTAILRSRRQ